MNAGHGVSKREQNHNAPSTLPLAPESAIPCGSRLIRHSDCTNLPLFRRALRDGTRIRDLPRDKQAFQPLNLRPRNMDFLQLPCFLSLPVNSQNFLPMFW
jgi:hypothetical protein